MVKKSSSMSCPTLQTPEHGLVKKLFDIRCGDVGRDHLRDHQDVVDPPESATGHDRESRLNVTILVDFFFVQVPSHKYRNGHIGAASSHSESDTHRLLLCRELYKG